MDKDKVKLQKSIRNSLVKKMAEISFFEIREKYKICNLLIMSYNLSHTSHTQGVDFLGAFTA